MNTEQPRKPRVAVVFGGRSSEHSVSCVTARGVLSAIDTTRFDVIPIGITQTGEWVVVNEGIERYTLDSGATPAVTAQGHGEVIVPLNTRDNALHVFEPGSVPSTLGEVDVVFPLLHGPFGEDGTIQGMLDMTDTRYVGCGVLASATMMDKHIMKVLFAGHDIPVGPYVVITDKDWLADSEAALAKVETLSYPVFVKPARAGSSMGITRVTSPAQLRAAVEQAREHDPKVVIEQGVVGREIECAVLEGRPGQPTRCSEVGEIVPAGEHEWYDAEAKYFDPDGAVTVCPADVTPAVRDRIHELSRRAFDSLGLEGLARCDFFVTPDNEVIMNEINTMPGFTPISMYPKMWEATGLPYTELITELIELALGRRLGLR